MEEAALDANGLRSMSDLFRPKSIRPCFRDCSDVNLPAGKPARKERPCDPKPSFYSC